MLENINFLIVDIHSLKGFYFADLFFLVRIVVQVCEHDVKTKIVPT